MKEHLTLNEYPTLTASDLKWLRSGTSRSWIVSLFNVAFFLGMSGLHLWLASLWAQTAGLTFAQVWQGWLEGIHSHQEYAGVYLKALEQFDKSAILLGFAVLSLAFGLLHRSERRRKARLLAVVTKAEQAAA